MRICGLVKTTLLDFPNKIACTIFTEGCNLCCPFCQNSSLVIGVGNNPIISTEYIFDFLRSKKRYLEGICISGGEPLIQSDIEEFIKDVRKIGYKIKLDTNGMFPEKLKSLIEQDLLDYVAMDIKTSFSRYWEATGVPPSYDFSPINESIELLKNSKIEHEFRTTAVKNFLFPTDFVEIAKKIGTNEQYFIQTFRDRDTNISNGLQGYSVEEEKEIAGLVKPYVKAIDIRV